MKAHHFLRHVFPCFWLALLGVATFSIHPLPAAETVFIKSGKEVSVIQEGSGWKAANGAIEGSGVNNFLFAGKRIGHGDFHLRARLAIHELQRSAASFVLDGTSHFGFEGANGQLFVQGPLFGNETKFLGPGSEFIQVGKPFLFEVVRQGTAIAFRLEGREVHRIRQRSAEFSGIGFRPWRSRMQVFDFSISGTVLEIPPPRTQPDAYTIPTIDLAAETDRQVIVDREAGQYLGHPTTVLLEDNRTMLAVYPKGHGRGGIVYKRSTDGGLTWSERLPTPESWASSREVPTLYRVIDAQGVKRLIMFSGLYPIRMAVSENDGRNWSELEPIGDFGGIVAMSSLISLKTGAGHYLALFHDDGRFLRGGDQDFAGSPMTKRPNPPPFVVYKSISTDGGLTWGQPEEIARHAAAHLCEPGAVRSPDGKQIAVLLRENSRKYNSFVIFSNDEGKTWTAPRELPAALTGDRHTAKFAPDGRLFITFRDTTLVSSTKGDWVGWVGTYDDIVEGREGEYRVRLMKNHKGADCAYPGLEWLPEGTFVTTTYGHWTEGELPYIASVRFKLAELDQRAAKLPQHVDVFRSGEEGYHTFRIPAVVAAADGTLLAFAEGRKNSRSDTGDIDLALKRSSDGGKTWGQIEVVWDDGANTCGNPCPVLDETTGTLWLLLTHNLGQDTESKIVDGTSAGTRTVWVTHSKDEGRTWAKPAEITATTKLPEWTWYATGPGVGIQMRHGPHRGRLVIPCDNKVAGTAARQSHVIYSDDHGATWKLGGVIGPNCNESQVVERSDGTLLINMRSYQKNNRRLIATSADGGLTWTAPADDPVLIEPVCQASLLRWTCAGCGEKSRLIFSNPASLRREKMTVRVSEDEGQTWPIAKELYAGPSAYSCLIVVPDGTIGCLYERGVKAPYETITFARFTKEWLGE